MRHQIANLFAAAGLSRFRLAEEVDTLLAQAEQVAHRAWWKWVRRCGAIMLIAFVVGFGACYAWYGTQVNVLQSTVSAWKVQYDAEHAKHHAKEARPISKAAAQVIVQRLEDAREGQEREP